MSGPELSLNELKAQLELSPTIVDMNPVSECFVQDNVVVLETSKEAAWFVDNPDRSLHSPLLIRSDQPLYRGRFPQAKCTHDPFTTEMNQVILNRFDEIRSRMLTQSQINNYILSKIARNTRVVVLFLVDGFNYVDVHNALENFEDFVSIELVPSLVDVPTLTRYAFPNIVGNPSVANQLFDYGFYKRVGFSYWTRVDNILSDSIFQGVSEVEKYGNFISILADIETLIRENRQEKLYIQILRSGLDGFVHSQKRLPPVAAIVNDVLDEFQEIIRLLSLADISAELYLTADHGILWRKDFDAHVVGSAPAKANPRCCGWRDLYDIQGQPRRRFELKGDEIFCLGYPQLRRPLRIDEQGVHGGISFEESITPFSSSDSLEVGITMLNIGRNQDNTDYVYIDSSGSRTVLVCGKRGSGKSYTLGVIVEELLNAKDTLVVLVDPMGIYYPMAQHNYEQEQLLWDWGLSAKGYPLQLLVPGEPEVLYGGREVIQVMESRGVQFNPFRINPADLSPDAWCELFDLSISDVMGIALFRAVQHLRRRRKEQFFIRDIIDEINDDALVADRTREALQNRLEMAEGWDIFSNRYRELWEIFDPEAANIVDLSTLDPGPRGRRNLIVDVLARDIFRRRTIARRKEELGLIGELPRVWMLIDEAHQFVPTGRGTLSKEILIRWAKEGRQPGLSLVVASQQPSAIDSEVITQCDILLAQKLTNSTDIQAVNSLSQDYMANELRTYIQQLDRQGEAVMVDDEQETVMVLQIRPRQSRHGGSG